MDERQERQHGHRLDGASRPHPLQNHRVEAVPHRGLKVTLACLCGLRFTPAPIKSRAGLSPSLSLDLPWL